MGKVDYNIVLIGFMGVGKSTVSKQLSMDLRMHEVDMDETIINREKMSIPEIFEKVGEEGFRDIESDCLKDVVSRTGFIISCGGGTVLRDENVEVMKKDGVVVLMTASPESVLERVKDSNNRPLLNGNMNVEYIAELMNKRKDRYEEVADITVSTDNKSIKEIADEIVAKTEEFRK